MPGGANWNNPTTTRNYATEVLPDIKTRDEDAITLLGGTAPSNLPTGAIKYNRTTDELQEWDGATFNTVGFALTSGGTGATDAAGARTNLGIGSLGTQNSNAISVTGGSISGLTSLGVSGNTTISGTLTISSTSASAIDVAGGINAGSGNVGIIGTDGRIPAITSTYFADLSAISGVAIPSGLIAMFDTSCPAGWTRVTALDSKFPMGNSTYGSSGGASTHSHTVTSHSHTMPANTGTTSTAHTHGVNILSGGEDNSVSMESFLSGSNTLPITPHHHGVIGNTGGMSANSTHSHTIGGSSGAASPTTDAINHLPPYLTVVWCRKD